jgi:gamma-glutamyltranspeptidase/glutathione hydrolase
MQRAAVLSTHPEAHEVAEEVLRDSGSAMTAALAGFFAAAGGETGVLFSPLTVLVAAGGAGVRVFDGRCRQPGLGAKRPRGFLPGEAIPGAAYAPVPGSVAAALVACAYTPGTSVTAVVRRGIAAARKSGAPRRAAVLDRVSSLGAGFLADGLVRGPLLGELGPAQGGLVSLGDLAPPREIDRPAVDVDGLWLAPWAVSDIASGATPSEGEPAEERSVASAAQAAENHVLCAVDVHGRFVGLAFQRWRDGLQLPDLELLLPRLAVPVRRGVPRVDPGAPLPAPAPLGIRRDASGQAVELVASPSSLHLAEPELTLFRDPSTLEVSVRRS